MRTDVELDQRTRAAIARLTSNERECLRRRLLPQTAKEMAIELGVSPHAVEKRLKMARTKLGLSSSLQAARLVAAAEGYEPPVPLAPDLDTGAETPDGPGSGPQRRRLILSGAIVMTLILAALVAFAPQQQTAPPDPAPGMRKATLDEAAALDREAFGYKDADHSGFLDPREASTLEPRDKDRDRTLGPAPAAGQPDPAAERKWMLKMDSDRDGKISRDEYVTYMIPWTLLAGVPVGWEPKR